VFSAVISSTTLLRLVVSLMTLECLLQYCRNAQEMLIFSAVILVGSAKVVDFISDLYVLIIFDWNGGNC